MIETTIRTRLLADAAVAALVADRVYIGIPPQRPSVPYIIVTKVDKVSPLTLDGAMGPNRLRLQIDCWAQGADEARSLATAVNGEDDQSSRGALPGFSSRPDSVRLTELTVERALDYEPDTRLYRIGADYTVHM